MSMETAKRVTSEPLLPFTIKHYFIFSQRHCIRELSAIGACLDCFEANLWIVKLHKHTCNCAITVSNNMNYFPSGSIDKGHLIHQRYITRALIAS